MSGRDGYSVGDNETYELMPDTPNVEEQNEKLFEWWWRDKIDEYNVLERNPPETEELSYTYPKSPLDAFRMSSSNAEVRFVKDKLKQDKELAKEIWNISVRRGESAIPELMERYDLSRSEAEIACGLALGHDIELTEKGNVMWVTSAKSQDDVFREFLASIKTAEDGDGLVGDEEEEESPEDDIPLEVPSPDDDAIPTPQETEDVDPPDFFKTISPFDADTLSTLEQQRQKALSEGNLSKVRSLDTQVQDILAKYETPPLDENIMSTSRLSVKDAEFYQLNDEVIQKAFHKLAQELGSIQGFMLDRIAPLTIRRGYLAPFDTGVVEFTLTIRKPTKALPTNMKFIRHAIVRVDVRNDGEDVLPLFWDTLGQVYRLTHAGFNKLFAIDTESKEPLSERTLPELNALDTLFHGDKS